MSDIDRIAEECVQRQEVCEQAADERVCVRNALLEYGAIVREECAKECETIEMQCYDKYRRGGPAEVGDPHWEGASDGAADCKEAIRNANKG